jgi:GcrA cell cycle regulator
VSFIPWTESEDELLAKMAADGVRAQLISDALKTRTKRAVIGRAHRLNVTLFAKRTRASDKRSPKPGQRVSNNAMSSFVPYVPSGSKVVPCDPKRVDELKPGTCKFPVTRDDDGEWLLCGLPIKSAQYCSSYCSGHLEEAYRPPQLVKKRA